MKRSYQSNYKGIMMIRFLLTLWLSKLIAFLMRLVGKRASYLPGSIAIKLTPDFLAGFSKPSEIIAVTGTNGKTTITNLLGDFFQKQGQDYFSNSYGSNTVEGIASTFINHSNLLGKTRVDRAVFEVDERSALKIFKHVHPDWMIVTNLFRDSYPRNAYPDFIFNILEEATPDTTHLILNSDDLISCFLKENSPNPKTFFSMNHLDDEVYKESRVVDLSNCPRCDHPLEPVFKRYNHIGRYRCGNCGFENIPGQIILTQALEESLIIDLEGRKFEVSAISDNPVDRYNVLAAVSLLYRMGYSPETIASGFEGLRVVKSRFYSLDFQGYKLYGIMAKSMNPIASSRTFEFVAGLEGNIALVFANPTVLLGYRNSEQMAWLYDLDFEYLKGDNIKQFILCGKRFKDYEVCMRMRGIDTQRIYAVGDFDNVVEAVDLDLVDTIVILNDTDTIEESVKIRNQILDKIKEGSHEN